MSAFEACILTLQILFPAYMSELSHLLSISLTPLFNSQNHLHHFYKYNLSLSYKFPDPHLSYKSPRY